jgi:N-acetylglucosaminyl-diphospho-decaprenol L-rhamnosyltransferase
MDVATVIVNFRTAEAAVDAVRSVLTELAGASDPRAIVVDNDSRDGSFEKLKSVFAAAEWQGRVAVVASGHNGGYGFGINVGVRPLLAQPNPPRYVYVINPDAVVEPGSLKRLVAFMDAHPDAGMAGGVVHDSSGQDDVKAFRFPSFFGELEMTAKTAVVTRLLRDHIVPIHPTDSGPVDWISGASMLIRREVFETAGLFDEGFFLYFEEVDFAHRARQAGWKVYYVADAGIGHIGSLATGMGNQLRRMPRYWFQARRRYLVKHHGALYGAACDAAWACGHAVFVAKAKMLRRNPVLRPRLWRDFVWYSVANFMKPAPDAEENAAVLNKAAGFKTTP